MIDIEDELERCKDIGYFISAYVLQRPLTEAEEEMIKQYQEWGEHFLIKNKVRHVKQRPLPTPATVLQNSKKDDTQKRRRYKRPYKGRGQK